MSRKKLRTRWLEDRIIEVFEQNPGRIMNSKQVFSRLAKGEDEVKPSDIPPLLDNLVRAGRLHRKEEHKYFMFAPAKPVQGSVEMTRGGRIFLRADDMEEDIPVTQSKVNILPYDRVEARLHAKGKKKMYAEIISVISRTDRILPGVLALKNKAWTIVADNQRFQLPFSVSSSPEFRQGYKVLFKISDFPKDRHLPVAEVTELLGKPGDHKTEMHAILAEFGLPESFDPWVQAASDTIPENFTDVDLKNREDFREVVTFTIDPDTAKDFDDAISYRKLKNGHTEIGVHIADVSHYLQSGTILDKEALNRATSVYLVDRVVPMLPFKLSDVICSLLPGCDRLTFAAIFDVDDHFRVVNTRFAKTVIHSDKRFTYEEAQEILNMKEGLYFEELDHLNRFAKHLSAERFANGAMSFESTEYKFVLDEAFRPVSMQVKVRQDTNKMIEELMLLANRSVAEFIHRQKPRKPFIYRTHDEPADLKLQELKKFVSGFGYHIQIDNEQLIRKSLNQLMADVEGKPEQDVIRNLCIRSMAKAVYTPNKPSHFGLAFAYYTHFTSPIRRYPDVIAHRLLYAYLQGKSMEDACGWDMEKLDFACKQSSRMEQLASDAERASVKYKQAEWMETQVGKTFPGVISGLTDFGIFVEIKSFRCEGLVRLSSMRDDHYTYDTHLMALVGDRWYRQYKLGDEVQVKVTASNKIRRTIDLELVNDGQKQQKHGRKHRRV